jgi:membrane protein
MADMESVFLKLIIYVKSFFQRLLITVQLYYRNGLANHSAACAYGFLLSMAPILLLIAFILSFTFKESPRTITALLADIPILENLFNKEWLVSDFFTLSRPGISGIVFAVSIIWAGRILSLSMQRGLKIIFPGDRSRNPVTNTLITLAIEAVVLIIILAAIFSSRTALWFYRKFDFLPDLSILRFFTSKAGMKFSLFFMLGLFSFLAYLFVPENYPRKLSALQGAFLCVFAYSCISLFLDFILDISRYDFLYGTLGWMIVLLVNVFFFFSFFLLGAQFAFVTDSFDALFFSKLRQITFLPEKEKKPEKIDPDRLISRLLYKLYFPHNGKMTRYLRFYKKDSVIFAQGDSGEDIYYLLDGEVEVLISSSQDINTAGIIEAGSFFGEMGHLLSEERSATIRAKTNITVFVLPPSLFDAVLKYDNNLDRDLIEHISRRLKNTNDKIAAFTVSP